MDLEVVGVLIKGEGKSPSPSEIAEVEEKIEKEGVKIIIVLATQKIGDEGRIAATISKDTGVALVYVYGVMFSGDDSYTEYIKYTVTSIASAIEAARSRGSYYSAPRLSQSTLIVSLVVLFFLVLLETAILVRGR